MICAKKRNFQDDYPHDIVSNQENSNPEFNSKSIYGDYVAVRQFTDEKGTVKKQAYCLVCGKTNDKYNVVIQMAGSNTSGIRSHLRLKHTAIFNEHFSRKKKVEIKDAFSSNGQKTLDSLCQVIFIIFYRISF